MHTLAEINRMDRPAFVATLGGVFEHSPWVAERAWKARPFDSLEALHAAMMQEIFTADGATRLALLRAHPELAGREVIAGNMTADSTSEQARLGLNAVTSSELAHMAELNRRYRERFGFPCIIALRLHADRASLLAEFGRRLANDSAGEQVAALEQVGCIAMGRLQRLAREK